MQASDWEGERFGAPKEGVGAVAPFGLRLVAFVLDCVLSALVAWPFTAPEAPRNWSLVAWFALTMIGVAVFGSSPGQAVMGVRVATLRPVGQSQFIGWWAVPRTILVALFVPPLLQDFDGRGLHDRLCRTIVVRAR